jgi:hypothetical protein
MCTARRFPDVHCIRRDDWKIIIEPSTAALELYNLLEDPGEATNLFGQGLAVEDTLTGLFTNVPGLTLGGWRIAFVRGNDSTSFKVEIEIPEGAAIEDVDKLTQSRRLVFGRSGERSMEVEAAPVEIDMLNFTVAPDDAPLTFRVTSKGGGTPEILIGAQGTQAAGAAFTLTRREAFGAPAKFRENRRKRVPSVHIWWLPGEQAALDTDDEDLTESERKRLRALGYIQ